MPKRAPKSESAVTQSADPAVKLTRTAQLRELMGIEGGASAADLAAAVGWQVHSVRGFISGTLKKRADLMVTATKVDGVTRYAVTDLQRAPA